jgi:hypothetical protein
LNVPEKARFRKVCSDGFLRLKMQDARCRMQDAGYRMQDTGYRIQDAGYRIQDAGCSGGDR